jgi:hypothetical protein
MLITPIPKITTSHPHLNFEQYCLLSPFLCTCLLHSLLWILSSLLIGFHTHLLLKFIF